jgi:Vacuolar sorting protein 9 (VPS9) domain
MREKLGKEDRHNGHNSKAIMRAGSPKESLGESGQDMTPCSSLPLSTLVDKEHAVRDVELAIQAMEDTQLCLHPQHLHSFRQINFLLPGFLSTLSSRVCAGCDQPLPSWSLSGWSSSDSILRCLACGACVHRKCAFQQRVSSQTSPWPQCPVNAARLSAVTTKEDRLPPAMSCSSSVSDSGNETRKNEKILQEECSNDATTLGSPRLRTESCEKFLAAPSTNPETDSDGTTEDMPPQPYSFATVWTALEQNIVAHFRRERENADTADPPLNKKMYNAVPINDPDDETPAENHRHPLARLASGAVGNLGVGAVVGGLAGGVAGMALAGPAGALVGYQFGSKACMLGIVIEGSVSAGVLAASVVTGAHTAQKVQNQIQQHKLKQNQRILTMGEHGIAQKLLLVRPGITIDPIWDQFALEARKSVSAVLVDSPGATLYPGSAEARALGRYRRDSDIVHCAEQELPTNEKVLLLVSRILSDKTRLPGHMYRVLISTFLCRCKSRDPAKPDDTAPCQEAGDPTLQSRIRRDDVHAVIKHVTATLLDVRPDLGATPQLTELTATAVEALVFGHTYKLVYEEILWETWLLDKGLHRKIRSFRGDAEGSKGCAAGHQLSHTDGVVGQRESSCSSETFVSLQSPPRLSQTALEALRKLPTCHTVVDKLECCVSFLECISNHFDATMMPSNTSSSGAGAATLGADSLLHICCQHVIYSEVPYLHAELRFVEEFAADQQLLRGREGYSLVTLQASLHYLSLPEADLRQYVLGPTYQIGDSRQVDVEDWQMSESEVDRLPFLQRDDPLAKDDDTDDGTLVAEISLCSEHSIVEGFERLSSTKDLMKSEKQQLSPARSEQSSVIFINNDESSVDEDEGFVDASG